MTRLNVVRRPDPSNGQFGGNVSANKLHYALRAATGPQHNKPKITNIGLLIADKFKSRPSIFGLMFDPHFDPMGTNIYRRKAREGCAVFLGGIKARRSKADWLRELLFTTVHELGHVFNLQHIAQPSYMARSAVHTKPFPNSGFTFIEPHKHLLSQCSASRHIYPGGSAFGDLGTIASANAPRSEAVAKFGIDLRIDMTQKEFWLFEPIELDVTLSIAGRKRRSVKLLDMVDPGYDEFKIWITEPDGKRRLYRSPRRYCKSIEIITITQKRPLVRDISIFAESGGFTFSKAGVHKISVEFNIPQFGQIVSNQLEINILTDEPSDDYFDAARNLLTRKDTALLLYYREFLVKRPRSVKNLSNFCDAYDDNSAVGMIRYALGSASLKFLEEQDKEETSANHLREATSNLLGAMKSPSMSVHRLAKVEKLLGSVGAWG